MNELEPRWLSAEERAAWLALLSTTTLLPGALESPLQQAAKLSLFEYNVLAMLSEEAKATLPMSELAARTSASLSRLSHVVKKLQGRGYVERSVHVDDARVTVVTITGVGLDLIRTLAPMHVESVRAVVFDQLNAKDVADLARIGTKLIRGLDESHWTLRTPAP
ncbi:DNA-binding transcriptional regulator, MarR family [Arthrobacter alpinus]|uniref:DNA-binding transcriptional regulator, MarR family n=1 Tax=Arthrobacter alpinus TaxID=656366 RepID=A0A0U3PRI0_9MICC|nr:MarR family winged helix-turn-helix transcriptional regulator [Arthrobacter alpinus]ALV46883.1 MarR family transcriptional regulator [Arthrobacter alpinus]SEE91799.1 DNA-binding transcriptional regulator, MarR family [Arthrobacter alpinus]